MPPSPYIEPLSKRKRQIIFIGSLCAFLIVVPLLVFYAIGYRFDFGNAEQNIRTVGGLYVSTDIETVQIYVDDKPVDDMRMFQQAAYVQNVTEGMHQVHVQGDGVNTWVKELPVLAHYVTEAKSFNVPTTPQLRVISEWNTAAGLSVLFEPVASTSFQAASTSNLFFIATSTATTSFVANPEYVFITSRFASSSQEAKVRQAQELRKEQSFLFAADLLPIASTTIATTTKREQDRVLYQTGAELYVTWRGAQNNIPYYFCVQSRDIPQIASWYGDHVADSFQAAMHASSTVSIFTKGQQWCRDTIQIDRQWETVSWFDFHPSLADTVTMQTESGLYAVEIDDRAWQNRQLLYVGTDFKTITDGNAIYIKDGEYIFELLPELIGG